MGIGDQNSQDDRELHEHELHQQDGLADIEGKWYSRGYLPHADKLHLMQSITFRLADSIPQKLVKKIEKHFEHAPESKREISIRQEYEKWLDKGLGCCALKNPKVAAVVQDTLIKFDDQKYHLIAWCVMPNHVHVLIDPILSLGKILQSWKSYTGRWALANNDNLNLGIPVSEDGKRVFWQREYWDRYIRDKEHYENVIDYIHNNPVKAGLCQLPEQWLWSSARYRK